MELLFLGTGGGMPSKQRNVTSIALMMPEYKGKMWLFDCGEATQHQILHTKVKLSKLEAIFITHLHGDHIFGLPGLLGTRSFQGAKEPLHLIGPKGLEAFINTALTTSSTYLNYDLIIQEIDEGVCYQDDYFTVETKLLEHGIDSYGFRIVEKDQPGQLLVEKLKSEGIMPGPIYREIKHSDETILSNGRKIKRAHFIGPTKKGRVITILGDTRPCESSILLAMDTDVLVHEATFDKDKKQLANEYYHSTTEQAANIAKTAGARSLILTHLSSRYQSVDDQAALVTEAKEIFENAYLAFDRWLYTIS